MDYGSTHNFLDLELAKKMGCVIKIIPSQAVTVANGNHLACQHVCKCFKWEMQGRTFTGDVMLISLEGFDMVLGVQWLATRSRSYLLGFQRVIDGVLTRWSTVYLTWGAC